MHDPARVEALVAGTPDLMLWLDDAGVIVARNPAAEAVADVVGLLPDSARVSYDFYCLYWPQEQGPVLTKMKGRAPLAWDHDGAEPVPPDTTA